MFGLCQDAEFPELVVEVAHEFLDPGLDDAEIMIVHLLSLGRSRAVKRPSGKTKIRAKVVHFLCDQEVFLLGPDGGAHIFDGGVPEKLQDPQALPVQRFHGTQKGCFLVQCFAAVGAERRRDAEGIVFDECIGSRIPGRISPGFKGRADTACREGGGVRLALDQFLAGELHDDAPVGRRCDERVMFFRRNACQRLEPVSEVGRALLQCPFLHGLCHRFGDGGIQFFAFIDRFMKGCVDLGRQPCAHLTVVKDK